MCNISKQFYTSAVVIVTILIRFIALSCSSAVFRSETRMAALELPQAMADGKVPGTSDL